MGLLDRFRNDREREREGVEGENPGGENLEELRLGGQELLAAGGAAIERTLSGNSEAFNSAVRQQGGE